MTLVLALMRSYTLPFFAFSYYYVRLFTISTTIYHRANLYNIILSFIDSTRRSMAYRWWQGRIFLFPCSFSRHMFRQPNTVVLALVKLNISPLFVSILNCLSRVYRLQEVWPLLTLGRSLYYGFWDRLAICRQQKATRGWQKAVAVTAAATIILEEYFSRTICFLVTIHATNTYTGCSKEAALLLVWALYDDLFSGHYPTSSRSIKVTVEVDTPSVFFPGPSIWPTEVAAAA